MIFRVFLSILGFTVLCHRKRCLLRSNRLSLKGTLGKGAFEKGEFGKGNFEAGVVEGNLEGNLEGDFGKGSFGERRRYGA